MLLGRAPQWARDAGLCSAGRRGPPRCSWLRGLQSILLPAPGGQESLLVRTGRASGPRLSKGLMPADWLLAAQAYSDTENGQTRKDAPLKRVFT